MTKFDGSHWCDFVLREIYLLTFLLDIFPLIWILCSELFKIMDFVTLKQGCEINYILSYLMCL